MRITLNTHLLKLPIEIQVVIIKNKTALLKTTVGYFEFRVANFIEKILLFYLN